MKRRLVPRKFERSAAIGEALVRPLAASPQVRVSVLNLAQSGAALFTTGGMKVGETVEMSFPLAKNGDSCQWSARDARVVRSRIHSDGSIVGVVFSRPWSDEEFAQLQAQWSRT